MTRIMAIANQKGGCGKTTTAINLSACLAERKNKTLIVDLDPQAHATLCVGLNPETCGNTIYEVLVEGDVTIDAVIKKTAYSDLEIVPSKLMLAGIELRLRPIARDFLIKKILGNIRTKYDFIIIDCPPALGFLTINAFTTSNEVIVPCQTEYLSMEGLKQLLETIDEVKTSLNRELKVLGLLPTLFDKRENMSKESLRGLKGFFKEKVFDTVINENTALAQASSKGMPIIYYNKNCQGTKDYRNLAKEVIFRGKKDQSLTQIS